MPVLREDKHDVDWAALHAAVGSFRRGALRVWEHWGQRLMENHTADGIRELTAEMRAALVRGLLRAAEADDPTEPLRSHVPRSDTHVRYKRQPRWRLTAPSVDIQTAQGALGRLRCWTALGKHE